MDSFVPPEPPYCKPFDKGSGCWSNSFSGRRYKGASTKSHASGKIKNRSFRILRMGSDVFFDADSESPHMT